MSQIQFLVFTFCSNGNKLNYDFSPFLLPFSKQNFKSLLELWALWRIWGRCLRSQTCLTYIFARSNLKWHIRWVITVTRLSRRPFSGKHRINIVSTVPFVFFAVLLQTTLYPMADKIQKNSSSRSALIRACVRHTGGKRLDIYWRVNVLCFSKS